EPGQVLVIDARGEQRSGTMGGMLVARMQARGAAGIVSDGPFRDGPFIAGLAITCGGVQVRPGDVVYGDDESVVVVPRHIARDVAREAHVKEREEAWIEQQILAGAPVKGTYPMSRETRERYERERREAGEG